MLTFWASIVLSRRTPVVKGYRPNLIFDAPGLETNHYGLVELYDTDGPVMPGEATLVFFRMFGHADLVNVLSVGTKFTIFEGNTSAGSGIVESVEERSANE